LVTIGILTVGTCIPLLLPAAVCIVIVSFCPKPLYNKETGSNSNPFLDLEPVFDEESALESSKSKEKL
jgi:hypothetical protein